MTTTAPPTPDGLTAAQSVIPEHDDTREVTAAKRRLAMARELYATASKTYTDAREELRQAKEALRELTRPAGAPIICDRCQGVGFDPIRATACQCDAGVALQAQTEAARA